jgi:hypothetical protein
MRKLLLASLALSALSAPLVAQPIAGAPTSSQNSQQRDLLLKYGARLRALDSQYRCVSQMADLVTSDQMSALKNLRISPRQWRSLIQLIGDNLSGNETDFAALRRKITRQAEDLLGSEQFDRLLELVPSPQQSEKVKQIWAQAAATPEGVAAFAAANELRASLSSDQQKMLGPVLDLLKPNGGKPFKAPVRPRPKKTPPVTSRQLVYLRRTGSGDVFAEIGPDHDFTRYLTRRYRIEGADQALLSAVSNESGLPVRVLGEFRGDVLKIAANSLLGPPALLSVDGDVEVWRGRLPARWVDSQSLKVELEAGRGMVLSATVEPRDAAHQAQLQALSGTFLLSGNCLKKGEQMTLVDVETAPYTAPAAAFSSAALVQLSEEFLHHAAATYLADHRQSLGGGTGPVRAQVTQLGLTCLGAPAGQVRVFGKLALAHTGLDLAEAEFEGLAIPSLASGRLAITPVPGSLTARFGYPLVAEVPASWMRNLEQIWGSEYTQGVSVACLDGYRDRILQSSAVQASQLDSMQFFSWPSGDRRTSLVSLAMPSQGSSPSDPLRSRLVAPAELTVAVGEEPINNVLRAKIPGLLPLKRAIPENMQKQGGVTLTDIEITELDLSFAQGAFQINNCALSVHWAWGLFSGVEPGIRFRGQATPTGSGDPSPLQVRLRVDSLDFISPRILGQSPEDQASLKQRLLSAMQDNPLTVVPPTELGAAMLSAQAKFCLTGADSSAVPSEFLLQGRLKP